MFAKLLKIIMITTLFSMTFFFSSIKTHSAFSSDIDDVPRALASGECFIKHRSKLNFSGSTYDFYTICSTFSPMVVRVSSSQLGLNTASCTANYYFNAGTGTWHADTNTTMEVFATTMRFDTTPYTDYIASCDAHGYHTFSYTGGAYGLPNPFAIGSNVLIWSANYTTDPTPPTFYKYYIEYPRTPLVGYLRLESASPCKLDITADPDAGFQPFSCTAGSYNLFQIKEGARTLRSITTIDTLTTPDAPDDYCSGVLSSNYNLLSTADAPLCKTTVNPLVEQFAPPFNGFINFDPDAHDWGAFDWLKVPAELLFNAIDEGAIWAYDIWKYFLTIILPNPEALSWTMYNIRSAVNEKFAMIDVSSLEAFSDLSAEGLEPVSVSLFGTTVEIINFDLIEDHIPLLRAVAVASVGLFIIIFNVNQVNKLLGDKEVTS